MKKLLVFCSILLLVSCILNPPAGTISLQDTLLDDQFIVSLAIEDDGTAWAGIIRDQYGLVKINTDGSTEIFDYTNSCLVDSVNIWEIEIDSQGKIWMLNEGLVCYEDSKFTRYDTIESIYVPISFENSMTIDNDDNVWFLATNPLINCSNFKIYSFDGHDFTSYDPAVLAASTCFSVSDIEVDRQGSIWFSFSYANDPVFIKYDGNEWTSFDTSDIGFTPHKITDMGFDSDNNLWFNDDYTFSSVYFNNQPGLYTFNGIDEAIPFGEAYYVSELSADDDNNIWVTGLSPRLGILDMNHRWVIDNSDNVRFCRVMQKAPDGNMWLGTSEGIKVFRYLVAE
ncbi:MAG: hypothetical protein KAH15_01570 [Candidatus Marinimicrobia bacterium]|nr:hypothetical protein [Candidatus Neomarinimicrobiota bacterium]